MVVAVIFGRLSFFLIIGLCVGNFVFGKEEKLLNFVVTFIFS
jgi:hypothetical protein